ncbi:putative CheY-like receiver [Vibrio nigripulchritudo SFn27]|uniref:Putative CheY-like receiver n=1 Tax=Vibrio nigripulchritudo TaxID=28173 RepID=U4KF28_9VIBR|nr:response regulator [Vibrio nigripulchritudo]CCN85206.1 putative CheY-like receiver [Vibrio nigripulchritudo BLFn1]CCN87644.1 putative CheY-like receiver [Vibrio nigripulchritudo SFn27]CCN92525.1 putative CheY-like receiver [Vibrio nigripulchritudo ENn2]CCO39388.1 putative CheY-like receiver [Vibrio nigripulchritudo SFn135]CCO53384.1 putative CheY-like receiver [Vibrio nigripulchritudo Wn13]
MKASEMFAKMTVMIVEDHDFSRKATLSMLLRLGVENILTAPNGQIAADKLECHQVDIVITDINMPEMNGIELLKAIRTGMTNNDKATKVIAVTSYSNTEVLRACMNLDINSFLVKPITIDMAKEKIVAAFGESAQLFHEHEYNQVNSDFDCMTEEVMEPPKIKEVKPESAEPILSENERFVSRLSDLEAGMCLKQDICTANGSRLIAAGVILNERLINRIHELSTIINIDKLKVELPPEDVTKVS